MINTHLSVVDNYPLIQSRFFLIGHTTVAMQRLFWLSPHGTDYCSGHWPHTLTTHLVAGALLQIQVQL